MCFYLVLLGEVKLLVKMQYPVLMRLQRCMGMFFHHFLQPDNFCNFLFASSHEIAL